MLVALLAGRRVPARDARRIARVSNEDDLYQCPVCHGVVIHRRGAVRIPHFAHRAHAVCVNKGKSQKHYEMQERIFRLLTEDPGNSDVKLEDFFPDVGRVADVSFKRGGYRFVVECQVSRIDSREIRKRETAYAKAGAKVLWVLDGGDAYTRGGKCFLMRRGWAFSLSEPERYLQEKAPGRLLYYFSKEPLPFWEIVFKPDSLTPAGARPLERIVPVLHPYRVAAEGTETAAQLAESQPQYDRVEEWLSAGEIIENEKLPVLAGRLRDHWRKENGPHALDFRWNEFQEIELGGNRISLTKGVRGGTEVQALWRASAFHRFIHGSKPFAELAILRFLRKHFTVNLAYLRRDIEGWLHLLAKEHILIPLETSKGIWKYRCAGEGASGDGSRDDASGY